MLFHAVIGAIVLFLVLAAAIAWWARAQVRKSRGGDARRHYLELASTAANDESGRSILSLLRALDTADADCPVTIDWVRRSSTRAAEPELLVRIAWDGNEWRRLFQASALRERLEAWLAAEPQLSTPRARELLATLEAESP